MGFGQQNQAPTSQSGSFNQNRRGGFSSFTGRSRGRGQNYNRGSNQHYPRTQGNYEPNRDSREQNYDSRPAPSYGNRGSSSYRGSASRGRGGFSSNRGRGGPPATGLKFATDVIEFIGEIDAHSSQKAGATSLAIWPESQQVFTGGKDGVVKMWDANGDIITEQNEGIEIGAIAFFSGYLFVGFLNPATPGQNVGFIKCYNFNDSPPTITEFKLSEQFPAAHQAQITRICINNDMVITASEDHTLRAWKLNIQLSCWTPVGNYGGTEAHGSSVTSLVSQGERTISGAASGEIKIWHTLQGAQINAVVAHEGGVTDIVYWENDSMKVVITCGNDSTIKVWDFSNLEQRPLQPVFVYQQRKPRPFSSLTPTNLSDGRPILVCGFSEGSIQIFDLPDFEDLGFLRGHRRNTAISSISENMNGLLYAVSIEGKIICYKFK